MASGERYIPISEEELTDLTEYNGASRRVFAIRRTVAELRNARDILRNVILDVASCDMSGPIRARICEALGTTEKEIWEESVKARNKSTGGTTP